MANSIKKVFVPLAFLFALSFTLIYSSCTKGVKSTCAYGGTRVGDSCRCVAGYQGLNCDSISREKFEGQWQVSEKGSATNPSEYSLSIQPSALVTGVTITNFYNYFQKPITATISYDTITIPNQELEGKVIFGTGIIYFKTSDNAYDNITLRYEVVDTATGLVNDFGYYPSDGSSASAWSN